MALQAVTGVFAKETTGAANATNTISAGFVPKAVILWATLNTSQDTFLAGANLSYGFYDGSQHFVVAASMQDAQATSVAKRWHDDSKALAILNATGTVIVEADVSFSGNDVIVRYTTNTTTAYLIHYLVLGGVQAKIQILQAPLSTGNQVRTGFGFMPKWIHIISAQDDTSPSGGVGENGAVLSFGNAANRPSRNKLSFGFAGEDAALIGQSYMPPISVASVFEPTYIKGGLPNFNGAISSILEWSNDGFTEFWSSAGGSTYYYAVLAIGGEGFECDIENDDTPTSSGDDTQVGIGFTPKMLLTFGSYSTAAAGSQDISFSVGAAVSTTTEHAAMICNDDGADPTSTDQRSSATNMLLGAEPGTPTLDVAATLASAFVFNQFTQNFGTAPSTARGQGWVILGDILPFVNPNYPDRHMIRHEVVGY